MEKVRTRFSNWIKDLSAKISLALLAVLIVQLLLVCICKDYPAIHPHNYEEDGNYSGMLLFVLWPVAYVLLELGLFVDVLAETFPQSKVLLCFYRGVMFIHFFVAAVLQIVDTGDKYYTLAYAYFACYVLSAILSIAIVILLFIEHEKN